MVTNIIDQLLTKMLLGKKIKWPSYNVQEIPRKMKSVVKLLHDFLVAILDRVPENDRIVILGRDLWPMVPLLRRHGRKTQYFLWSRLQCNSGVYKRISSADTQTAKAWIKEVHPDSWVVDTGFYGTIFDAIRSIDFRIRPRRMLMGSSAGKYEQLLPDSCGNLREEMLELEHLQKIVGSSTTYHFRSDESGWQEASPVFSNRDSPGDPQRVIESNYTLLRALNCTEQEAIQYSHFTGLSSLERLGMRGPDRRAFYRLVRQARHKEGRVFDCMDGSCGICRNCLL